MFGYGFFLYYILNEFIPICEQKGDIELKNKCENIKISLKKSLNTTGWDGRWYKRAFMDDGNWLAAWKMMNVKLIVLHKAGV